MPDQAEDGGENDALERMLNVMRLKERDKERVRRWNADMPVGAHYYTSNATAPAVYFSASALNG